MKHMHPLVIEKRLVGGDVEWKALQQLKPGDTVIVPSTGEELTGAKALRKGYIDKDDSGYIIVIANSFRNEIATISLTKEDLKIIKSFV